MLRVLRGAVWYITYLDSAARRDIAQAVEHPPVKVKIIQSSLNGGCICSLGYFPFQPVIHDWSFIHVVCGKDPLMLIRKSILSGDIGFHLKNYVKVTICLMSNSRWYENQSALDASLNKANFLDNSAWLHSKNRGHRRDLSSLRERDMRTYQ